MTLSNDAQPVPLTTDAGGVVRVGGTRVTLDTVVRAFEQGLSVEEIVLRYPSLDLADAYAAISYYLRNRSEVEAYLAERRQFAEQVRRVNEARFDLRDIRERLLARRAQRQSPER